MTPYTFDFDMIQLSLIKVMHSFVKRYGESLSCHSSPTVAEITRDEHNYHPHRSPNNLSNGITLPNGHHLRHRVLVPLLAINPVTPVVFTISRLNRMSTMHGSSSRSGHRQTIATTESRSQTITSSSSRGRAINRRNSITCHHCYFHH